MDSIFIYIGVILTQRLEDESFGWKTKKSVLNSHIEPYFWVRAPNLQMCLYIRVSVDQKSMIISFEQTRGEMF